MQKRSGIIKLKIRTALIRSKTTGLSIKRSDVYKSNKDFAVDLRSNGFKVLKVWDCYKSDSEVDNWELINRK